MHTLLTGLPAAANLGSSRVWGIAAARSGFCLLAWFRSSVPFLEAGHVGVNNAFK